MFYLEKRIPHTRGGLIGYRWAAIYYCPERWPLELLLKHLDKQAYRIIPKKPKEGCGNEPGRIIKIAAEAGAKAAMETLDRERQRDRQEMADRRLWNTKLLLKNYRSFEAHVANSVFTVDDYMPLEEIWADLMMPGRDSTLFVESIKQSVARTATIVKHMEAMMDLYKVYCTTIGTAEDERRWRIINGLYISDERKSVKELAQAEGVVERTIYKDIDIACERIAALMFGVDGLKRR